jgi:hypothetical protein
VSDFTSVKVAGTRNKPLIYCRGRERVERCLHTLTPSDPSTDWLRFLWNTSILNMEAISSSEIFNHPPDYMTSLPRRPQSTETGTIFPSSYLCISSFVLLSLIPLSLLFIAIFPPRLAVSHLFRLHRLLRCIVLQTCGQF